MRAQTLLATIALVLSAAPCAALDGEYDATFGDGGRVLTPLELNTTFSQPRIRVLADGRLLVAGTCRVLLFSGAADDLCVARVDANGRGYDAGFGNGGAVALHEFAGFPTGTTLLDLLLRANGKALLVGFDPNTGGILVAQLVEDGSALDASVAGRGWFEFFYPGDYSYGIAAAEQRDGKVLIAGQVYNGNNGDFAVARFNADLNGLDPDFGTSGTQRVAFDLGGASGGSTADVLGAIAVQQDGGIVLAGQAYSAYTTTPAIDAASAVALARLRADGQPDATFGPGHDGREFLSDGDVSAATALLIDRRGRIVFGGFVANKDLATGYAWLIGRVAGDGTPDVAFNGGVPQVFLPVPGVGGGQPLVRALAQQADGKILVAGVGPRDSADSRRWWSVARVGFDGGFDAQFGNLGRDYGTFTYASYGCCGYSDEGSAVALGGGGIVIAGTGTVSASTPQRLGLARLTLDAIFQDGFEEAL